MSPIKRSTTIEKRSKFALQNQNGNKSKNTDDNKHVSQLNLVQTMRVFIHKNEKVSEHL